MWIKYCKKVRPHLVEGRGGSLIWKNMLEARYLFDQQSWWELKCGHSSVWYDNWTQLGALHYYLPIDLYRNTQLEEVNQRFMNGK